jgi:hypothetical protein
LRTAVGKLLWLSHDRPDIKFAVGRLAADAANPTEETWSRAKRVARYLRGAPLGATMLEPRGGQDVQIFIPRAAGQYGRDPRAWHPFCPPGAGGVTGGAGAAGTSREAAGTSGGAAGTPGDSAEKDKDKKKDKQKDKKEAKQQGKKERRKGQRRRRRKGTRRTTRTTTTRATRSTSSRTPTGPATAARGAASVEVRCSSVDASSRLGAGGRPQWL